MRIFFSRRCSSQLPYALGSGTISSRERLELESHAVTCLDCAEALRDAVVVDAALRRAYAPLRGRRTVVAPGRVRMAVAQPRPEARPWLRMPALFARLAEVSVALGVCLFAVTGSIELPQAAAPESHSVIREYFRAQPPSDDQSIDYFRWLRAQPVAAAAASPVRLPLGGRFDVDEIEVVATPTSTPR